MWLLDRRDEIPPNPCDVPAIDAERGGRRRRDQWLWWRLRLFALARADAVGPGGPLDTLTGHAGAERQAARRRQRLAAAGEAARVRLRAAEAVPRLVRDMTAAARGDDPTADQFLALRVALRRLAPARDFDHDDNRDGLREPELTLAWALTDPDPGRAVEIAARAAGRLAAARLLAGGDDSEAARAAREESARAVELAGAGPPHPWALDLGDDREARQAAFAAWVDHLRAVRGNAAPAHPVRRAMWRDLFDHLCHSGRDPWEEFLRGGRSPAPVERSVENGVAEWQAAAFSCVVGEPGVPKTAPGGWMTGELARLAASVRAPAADRVPELVAGLTAAGCDDEALLAHLRGGPHLGECWALSLLARSAP